MNFLFFLFISLPIILESLPVSSSGHMRLLEQLAHFFSWQITVPSSHELDCILHGPIVIVLAFFFYPRWSFFIKYFFRVWPIIIKLMGLGLLTEIMTGLLYALFSFIGFSFFPLPFGFFITSLMLFALPYCPLKNAKWNWKNALFLGTLQGIALLPGISRFGATFFGARLCGFSPKKAFGLSFLIEWPISFAGFIKGIYGLYSQHVFYELLNLTIWLVMLIASIISLTGFFFIATLVQNNKLWIFSWYMLILSFIAHFICC